MQFRHEVKHEISNHDMLILRQRLKVVMKTDSHTINGKYKIRSMNCTDFLNPDCVMVPIMESPCILEVKWDNYLPDVIRDAVQLEYRHSTAFSKYAASRMYD